MELRVIADRGGFAKSVASGTVGALAFNADKVEAIGKLLDKLKALGVPESFVLPLLGSLAFLAAIYYFVQALSQRSRLLQPERFRLRRDAIAHLKGRQREIEDLGRLCERSALVFLEGESGAGKSALVAAGLVDWCGKDGARPLPVHLDVSGAPWDEGLAEWLARALLRATTPQPPALGWSSPPSAADVWQRLGDVDVRLGRKALVAVDQFDDYQEAHRQHFYRAGGGELVTPQEFLAANAFWQALAAGVQARTWHVLFVTRSDQRAGLDLVRFVQPESYLVERVARNAISPVFDEVCRVDKDAPPVVANPDKGWTLLRDKLLDDLGVGAGADVRNKDDVLPIQLAVALEGLQSLDYLTLGSYQRAGGMSELARLYIQREMRRVAQTHRRSTPTSWRRWSP